jgi:hypothetical protein
MSKVAFKTGKGNKDLAKIVFKHWKKAIDANNTYIDRNDLLTDLEGILDVASDAGTGKKVQLDVVIDGDLDAQTRLVWLAIPTPDPKLGDNWGKFKKHYYDDKNAGDKEILEEALGQAVLFGCGR